MKRKPIRRSRKLRKLLEKIAFASLIVDVAIAVVTLISINFSEIPTTEVIAFLNYVLTIIVIVTVIVFVTMMLLLHREKTAEWIALVKKHAR